MRPTSLDLRQRATLRGVEDLISQGCTVGGISTGEFYSRRRTAAVCKARCIVWIAMRRRGFSLPEIGWLSGRDHSSVLSALRGLDVGALL